MLDAADYTVEATTYFAGLTGNFTLLVRPLERTKDQAGTVNLSLMRPVVGTELTAMLQYPDDGVTGNGVAVGQGHEHDHLDRYRRGNG